MTTGVWLVGARGNVASISMAGARAIASGVVDSTGMVTAREPMTSLDLPAVDDLVFGGHDIREQSIEQTVEKANEAGNVPDKETLDAVREDLREIDERVTIGTARQCGQVVEDLSDNEVGDKGRSQISFHRSRAITRRLRKNKTSIGWLSSMPRRLNRQ